MRYLLLITVLSFSGCITIKYLPPPCKKDTIYIEKDPIYKSIPMWPNPKYIDTIIVFPWLDTSKANIKLTPLMLSDILYKGISMKAQQITNEKR